MAELSLELQRAHEQLARSQRRRPIHKRESNRRCSDHGLDFGHRGETPIAAQMITCGRERGVPDDFGAILPGQRVLMSLKPEYYELMWQGLKTHEFRRRYLQGQPTTWYVYLTAPVSKLIAVIDLAEAVVGPPRSIADIAERANPGNGESVYAYLHDVELAHAMPIRTIREYPGFTADELATLMDEFQPPQGYTLIDKHEDWARVCEQLTKAPVVRELVVQHPTQRP